jgi:hypothetical protein
LPCPTLRQWPCQLSRINWPQSIGSAYLHLHQALATQE